MTNAMPMQDYSCGEDAAPAKVIAKRSANQYQGGEKKAVGLDHPQNVGCRGVKVALQRRKRHVHDRSVDERHT
jgi:hypothetical protein